MAFKKLSYYFYDAKVTLNVIMHHCTSCSLHIKLKVNNRGIEIASMNYINFKHIKGTGNIFTSRGCTPIWFLRPGRGKKRVWTWYCWRTFLHKHRHNPCSGKQRTGRRRRNWNIWKITSSYAQKTSSSNRTKQHYDPWDTTCIFEIWSIRNYKVKRKGSPLC